MIDMEIKEMIFDVIRMEFCMVLPNSVWSKIFSNSCFIDSFLLCHIHETTLNHTAIHHFVFTQKNPSAFISVPCISFVRMNTL